MKKISLINLHRIMKTNNIEFNDLFTEGKLVNNKYAILELPNGKKIAKISFDDFSFLMEGSLFGLQNKCNCCDYKLNSKIIQFNSKRNFILHFKCQNSECNYSGDCYIKNRDYNFIFKNTKIIQKCIFEEYLESIKTLLLYK